MIITLKSRPDETETARRTLAKRRINLKLLIGLLIGLAFLFFAFRRVDFAQMGKAFFAANYWYVLLGLFLLFFSHWLRAVRWHLLLAPIRTVKIPQLFSALMIGYMANVFTPAHLGEFLRAYVLGKRSQVSASSVFATIVIERIIDVFTLLFLMALTLVVFPFPEWVRKSGYFTFIGVVLLFVLLILMKRHRQTSLRFLAKLMKPLPERIASRVDELFHSFLDGVVGLKNWGHYAATVVLSLLIWACYGAVFQMCLYAFSFVSEYDLPWTAALVLLVITTISVLVPSSPGYVGTYHWLCQISLGLFAVPKSEALTFAFVAHGLNFIPALIVGLVFASIEGVSLTKASK